MTTYHHIATGSSNVATLGYDTDTRVLEVAFHSGATYTYADVPPEKYFALATAPSIGRHLATHIKPHHHAARVPER